MTRRSDRRWALLAGCGLALLFTLCGAFQVAAWSVGKVDRTTHRVLSGPVDELMIESSNGDVTLVASADDKVRIEGRSEGTLHTPAPEIDVIGSSVHISANCPVWGFGECHSSVIVHVPTGTEVTVDATSGDIVAEGLTAGVDLQTSSGDIAVDGLSGDVSLCSASGDIVARGLHANLAKAKTASGDVDLRFATVPKGAEALTSSGDARILVPPGPESYNVLAESGSGDTVSGVRESDDATSFLRVETSSGDVTVDYGG